MGDSLLLDGSSRPTRTAVRPHRVLRVGPRRRRRFDDAAGRLPSAWRATTCRRSSAAATACRHATYPLALRSPTRGARGDRHDVRALRRRLRPRPRRRVNDRAGPVEHLRGHGHRLPRLRQARHAVGVGVAAGRDRGFSHNPVLPTATRRSRSPPPAASKRHVPAAPRSDRRRGDAGGLRRSQRRVRPGPDLLRARHRYRHGPPERRSDRRRGRPGSTAHAQTTDASGRYFLRQRSTLGHNNAPAARPTLTRRARGRILEGSDYHTAQVDLRRGRHAPGRGAAWQIGHGVPPEARSSTSRRSSRSPAPRSCSLSTCARGTSCWYTEFTHRSTRPAPSAARCSWATGTTGTWASVRADQRAGYWYEDPQARTMTATGRRRQCTPSSFLQVAAGRSPLGPSSRLQGQRTAGRRGSA